MNAYKIFIVMNSQEFEIEQTGQGAPDEESLQEAMRQLRDAEEITVTLVSGDILTVGGIKNKDVYFYARKEQTK